MSYRPIPSVIPNLTPGHLVKKKIYSLFYWISGQARDDGPHQLSYRLEHSHV